MKIQRSRTENLERFKTAASAYPIKSCFTSAPSVMSNHRTTLKSEVIFLMELRLLARAISWRGDWVEG